MTSLLPADFTQPEPANDFAQLSGSVKLYAQIFFGIWQNSITRDLVPSLCCFLVG